MSTFHAWQRRMMVWQAIAALPAIGGAVAFTIVIVIDPLLFAGRTAAMLAGLVVSLALAAAVMIFQGVRIARLRNRVRQRRAAVCIECLTDLPDDERGVCPSCSLPYTRVGNVLLWNIPDKSLAVPPPRRRSPAFYRQYKRLVVLMVAVAGFILLINMLTPKPSTGTFSMWRSAGAPIVANLLGAGIMVMFVFRFMRTVQRERNTAIARRGAVCTECAYALPDNDSGTCPECGQAYTRASNAEFWGISLVNADAPTTPTEEPRS
ncbi:MAG: hypothetical protein JNL50_01815 [Phycisphaerae bacterium]|nr:hypothetical protein [Phycisphaerae bacterium]